MSSSSSEKVQLSRKKSYVGPNGKEIDSEAPLYSDFPATETSLTSASGPNYAPSYETSVPSVFEETNDDMSDSLGLSDGPLSSWGSEF